MPFEWKCPCGSKNNYKGIRTLEANSTCSNCKKTQKIWSKRVKPKVPTKSNQIQPNKLEVPTIKNQDLSLGYDFNKSVIIEGLNDTIRIYKNSYVNREGSRVSKKNASSGKKILEWVERHENQLSVPLLVTYHPYFVKVLAAYQELKKLR